MNDLNVSHWLFPRVEQARHLGTLRVSLACAIINRQWERASFISDVILDGLSNAGNGNVPNALRHPGTGK